MHTPSNAQKCTITHLAHNESDIGTVKAQLQCNYGALNLFVIILSLSCPLSCLSSLHAPSNPHPLFHL